MNIGIDAVGNHLGGGLRVLKSILLAAKEQEVHNITLWCTLNDHERRNLPTLPTWTIHNVSWAQSLAGRVHWFQSVLQHHVEAANCDTLLCLNGMGIVDGVRQINFLQQPLLYAAAGLARMPTSFALRMLAIRTLTTASCARAAHIIVQSPTMARDARTHLGLNTKHIKVLTPDATYIQPSGVQKKAEKPSRVLYIGHDEPYKNMSSLYRAMALCHRVLPEITLTVTHHATEAPANAPWLRAIGPQDPARIAALIQRSDVLVMPSLAETVGLPMIEAMTLGCPVIAADLPYARDICDRAALFTHPLDAQATASALLDILTLTTLSESLSERGRRRAIALMDNHPYSQLIHLLASPSSC